MAYIVISLTALFVSGLTLFSGFGLGTVLMPAFALFFPVPVAIAATAVVHLANNGFKLALVGRRAGWGGGRRFSLPAPGAPPARYLVLGGALSGFCGGLSGNQGAFRSAFLIKAGLDKQAFVGTSVVSTI